jgi:hypothetical protein
MTNKQDVFQRQDSPINFVNGGMELGSKAGFRLSLLYAIFSIFLVLLAEALRDGFGSLDLRALGASEWYGLTHAVPLFLLIVLLILFVAVAPATILGILTGMLLGKFVEIFIGRLSKYVLVVSCAFLCMIIATLIHLFFNIPVVFSFQPAPIAEANHFSMGVFESYPFYMGIPTLLYVLAGGWIGWQLYLKSLIQMDEKN